MLKIRLTDLYEFSEKFLFPVDGSKTKIGLLIVLSSSRSGWSPMRSSCAYGNELLDSIKGGELLHYPK